MSDWHSYVCSHCHEGQGSVDWETDGGGGIFSVERRSGGRLRAQRGGSELGICCADGFTSESQQRRPERTSTGRMRNRRLDTNGFKNDGVRVYFWRRNITGLGQKKKPEHARRDEYEAAFNYIPACYKSLTMTDVQDPDSSCQLNPASPRFCLQRLASLQGHYHGNMLETLIDFFQPAEKGGRELSEILGK